MDLIQISTTVTVIDKTTNIGWYMNMSYKDDKRGYSLNNHRSGGGGDAPVGNSFNMTGNEKFLDNKYSQHAPTEELDRMMMYTDLYDNYRLTREVSGDKPVSLYEFMDVADMILDHIQKNMPGGNTGHQPNAES